MMSETIDFSKTVIVLEAHARSARYRAYSVFILLVVIVAMAVGVITYRLLNPLEAESMSVEAQSDYSILSKKLPVADITGKFEQKTTAVEIIISAVFSLGAFALAIYLMQIAVTFMRYYLQAAEIYDAQANSLRSSNGDPELAWMFMERFGPPPPIGKTNSNFNDKALEAITSLASSVKRNSD